MKSRKINKFKFQLYRSPIGERTKPNEQILESHLQTNQYTALKLIASINRILGWLTIAFSLTACVAMFAKTDVGPMTIGLVVGGVIAGAAQIAFAELIELFMKLQMNTQYMCDRLFAIESKIESLSRQDR